MNLLWINNYRKTIRCFIYSENILSFVFVINRVEFYQNKKYII